MVLVDFMFDGFSLNYWMPKLIVLEVFFKDHIINHDKHEL